ncbi:hypothetical protein R11007_03279 [Ralstonia holmesii]|uniref:Uncharacterized protein n=1 Tax=Ralstonia holmesii TaxID=3058602 RepID=A0ABC8QJ85_9RALS|nr:hypothetical protein R11007_03279 [Ralstonia sp. LMG 32967]CAJ0808076.1 hypothetical protein LMG18096_05046 [Ralstonia sp. LMG 32967]
MRCPIGRTSVVCVDKNYEFLVSVSSETSFTGAHIEQAPTLVGTLGTGKLHNHKR